jgi:hypothetical protein
VLFSRAFDLAGYVKPSRHEKQGILGVRFGLSVLPIRVTQTPQGSCGELSPQCKKWPALGTGL